MEPGTRLGPYEIIESLGEGGMGEVYRARDSRLDRDVAVKLVRSDRLQGGAGRPGGHGPGGDGSMQELLREARTAASLNHPHVCTIYEVGEDGGQAYIGMELVEGRGLHDIVPPGGLPAETVIRIGCQIAAALSHAHSRGVVHRDLKPRNVVITAEADAKVLDFGLAYRVGERQLESFRSSKLTLAEMDDRGDGDGGGAGISGTLPYMAPEVLRGDNADGRSDLWALGVLLYEAATGELPFEGRTGFELTSAILKDACPGLPEGVPPGLAAVIRKCLSKEPVRRYRNAGEVQTALEMLEAPAAGVAAAELTGTATSPAGTAAPVASRWRTVRSRGLPLVALIVALGAGAVVLDVGDVRSIFEGSRSPDTSSPGGSAPEIRSIAVLPLANVSGDPGQEWFADGMTEMLITELSRVRTLKVISRTSAMRYKGSDKPLREIAAELGVDAVVDGSALWLGDQVRITAQLIDAASDHHLWADDYDGEVSDALTLHREVARKIAGQVQATLSPAEQRQLQRASTVDPQATVAYLRGLDHYNSLGLPAAEVQARRAIALDPGFARGHDLLAGVLHAMWEFSLRGYGETVPEARIALRRALELEPDLANSQALLGFSLMTVDHDWEAAAEHLQAAYELDPSTGWMYAYWLQARGRFDEAIEAAHQTVERDPANPLFMCDLATIYSLARRHDEEIRWYRKALEIDPGYGFAHAYLYRAYLNAGRPEEAFEAFLESLRMSRNSAMRQDVGRYEQAYREGGWPAIWRTFLQRIDDYDLTPQGERRLRLRTYLHLGETAEALDLLERLEELGDTWLTHLRRPLYDPLRDEPRFKDLLRRLGYPEEMWR